MANLEDNYDVVIVGGGPAGTTCGHLLAKRGHRVLMVEKEEHPRFRIGESLLPHSTKVWDELGLFEVFEKGPYARKYGAWFDFADGTEPETFYFGQDNPKRGDWAWNVERSWFDQILWDAALAAGANGVQNAEVTAFHKEGEGAAASISGVDVRTQDGTSHSIKARLTIDASGRLSLVGKLLGLRSPDPRLNMVAMYGHYENTPTLTGKDAGTIGIIAMADGWAWVIPFDEGKVSVGIVARNTAFAERVKGRKPADVFLDYVAETAAVHDRLGPDPVLCRDVESTANFSFRCSALAGSGWVLAGDAGAFVDPVFSSGVHLAMEGSRRLVLDAHKALSKGQGLVPKAAFAKYEGGTRKALKVFTRFIYKWYEDEYRWAFMRPPPNSAAVQFIKNRILRVLAGDVFQPWRVVPFMWTLEMMAKMNAAGVKRLNAELPPPGRAPQYMPGRENPPPQLPAS
ncbi:MAG: tryptophan 7-halogenase [Deltaproteobacteria bacterium]|nr:tryptophan 7-halogenase [Deltaproteobacteria bacterium]